MNLSQASDVELIGGLSDGLICVRGAKCAYQPVLDVAHRMRLLPGMSIETIEGELDDILGFHAHVTIGYRTIDINTRESIRLVGGGKVYPNMPIAEQIRGLARELILHELDEWVAVDGVPLNDPHRRVKR